MKTSEFDYLLPPGLVAQQPADKRDQSRLMVLNRERQTIEHRHFYNLVDYLYPGDLLVLNDTKVLPANLMGKKEEGGARVEILLVSRKQTADSRKQTAVSRKQIWECLVRPGKRLNIGARVIFGRGELIGKVLEKTASGEQIIEFSGELEKFMRQKGEIPLPPYIKSNSKFLPAGRHGEIRNSNLQLAKRYQTVYAKKEGAAAAPTAGLHFTPQLLKKIARKGIKIAYVTLHTGLATFKPVYAENVEEHQMYSEPYEVPAATVKALGEAKRVVAVGTTSVRTLETIGKRTEQGPVKGSTGLYIFPSYKFKVVDVMITNFHWPRTTLLMLVAAFAGKDFILRAYQEAIDRKYRFFSFGDAMLIE